MAQPRPVLPSQPRRRSLERLEAEIAEAEADRGRWAGRAAGLRSRRLDDRAELALVRIAEDRPDGLDRSRAVLLGAAGGRRRRRRTRARGRTTWRTTRPRRPGGRPTPTWT